MIIQKGCSRGIIHWHWWSFRVPGSNPWAWGQEGRTYHSLLGSCWTRKEQAYITQHCQHCTRWVQSQAIPNIWLKGAFQDFQKKVEEFLPNIVDAIIARGHKITKVIVDKPVSLKEMIIWAVPDYFKSTARNYTMYALLHFSAAATALDKSIILDIIHVRYAPSKASQWFIHISQAQERRFIQGPKW